MTTLLESLDRFGAVLPGWIIGMNAWTLALLGVVLLVDRALGQRVGPAVRVALYAVIALRLALPLAWGSPLAFPVPAPATLAASEGGVWVETAASPAAAAEADALRPAVDPAPRLTGRGLVTVAYGAGAAALLAFGLTLRLRLRRRLRAARPCRPSVARLLPQHPVLETLDVGPALAGLLHPRIVVPSALCDALTGAELARVLRHEAAHLERRDHLLAAGCQVLAALAWPVAAVWIAAHRVRVLMEMACDERAVRGADAGERCAYGRTLLHLAAGAAPYGRRLARVGLLGQASAGLRVRLRALTTSPRCWPRGGQWLTTLAAVVVLLACATSREADRPAAAAMPESASGMVLVTAHVFEGAAPPPGVSFDVRQGAADAPAPSDVTDGHRIDAAAFRAYLLGVRAEPAATVLSAPRLLVRSGENATVTVALADEDDAVVERLRLSVTPTINPDGTITLTMRYDEYGVPVSPPASTMVDGDHIAVPEVTFTLPATDTCFARATGAAGAPTRLIAISADTAGPRTTFAAPPESDRELTHVEYDAVVWDTTLEPDVSAIVPGATSVASPAADRARLDLVAVDATRPLTRWWRDHATFRLGGKDGARLVPEGETVGYDLPATRLAGVPLPALELRLASTLDRGRTTAHLVWSHPGSEGPVVDTRVSVGPQQALIVTVPVADGVWRTLRLRVWPADPDAFRGQTAAGEVILVPAGEPGGVPLLPPPPSAPPR